MQIATGIYPATVAMSGQPQDLPHPHDLCDHANDLELADMVRAAKLLLKLCVNYEQWIGVSESRLQSECQAQLEHEERMFYAARRNHDEAARTCPNWLGRILSRWRRPTPYISPYSWEDIESGFEELCQQGLVDCMEHGDGQSKVYFFTPEIRPWLEETVGVWAG